MLRGRPHGRDSGLAELGEFCFNRGDLLLQTHNVLRVVGLLLGARELLLQLGHSLTQHFDALFGFLVHRQAWGIEVESIRAGSPESA